MIILEGTELTTTELTTTELTTDTRLNSRRLNSRRLNSRRIDLKTPTAQRWNTTFRLDETPTFKLHVVKILLPKNWMSKIHRNPESEKSNPTHISRDLLNPKNGVSHRRSSMFFGRMLSCDEFLGDVFWTDRMRRRPPECSRQRDSVRYSPRSMTTHASFP